MGQADLHPQDAISALFKTYAERYMAGDAEFVATMYGAPFLAVRSGRVIYLPDRPAVTEHLAGLMAGYRNSGAARADIEGIDLLSQGNRAVAATVHWVIRAPDATVVRDFRTTYQLVGADPWTIVAYVNHDVVDP